MAKQEMTLLPSFLFRQGTGTSPGNPPLASLRTLLLPDKRLSFPVLVTKEGLTVVFWTGNIKLDMVAGEGDNSGKDLTGGSFRYPPSNSLEDGCPIRIRPLYNQLD